MLDRSASCCGRDKISEGGCCGTSHVLEKEAPKECSRHCSPLKVHRHSSTDLEQSLVRIEHVTLAVHGMTCSGCESKLYQMLSSMPSIAKIRTSLVLSRADFDLDVSINSPGDIIAQIQRSTNFKCERLSDVGHHIDVIITDTAKVLLDQPYPAGVMNMAILDKQIMRIFYNPAAIGSRDLLETGFGTPLQLAPSQNGLSSIIGGKHTHRMGYLTLLSIALTIPVLVLSWGSVPAHPQLYGGISLLLATIIQVVIGGPFYLSSFKSLFLSHAVEMDFLLVVSTSMAYGFSLVSFGYLMKGEPLSTGLYFDSSTLLMTLIMLGRYISAVARQKALDSISICSLQPPTAFVVNSDCEAGMELDARLLQYGDAILVLPGSQVVTDGIIISGTSEIDESATTGESSPVLKSAGCAVVAGSTNGSGTLKVRVTALPGSNTISAIANMVDESKLSKPKMQKAVDRVTSYFVPSIGVCAAATFVVWTVVCIAVRGQKPSDAIVQAITYTIAVLIVSCPCALALGVPLIFAIASGVGATHGVVFKSAEAIEIARRVSHVVFDKTGTLTRGHLQIHTELYHVGLEQQHTLSILLGLTSGIEHPVSRAVAKHLRSLGVVPAVIEDIKIIHGSGVEGLLNGVTIRAGNSRWLGVDEWPQVRSLLSHGLTAFCVAIGPTIAAIYTLHDDVRPDALSVIDLLRGRGIAVYIVSGDDDGAVKNTAIELRIPKQQVKSCCSPADKQQYVKDLQRANEKNVVIFCGDGTNDAAALARASVGLHMNEGTQLAQSAADVVLMRPTLYGILAMIRLSEAVYRRTIMSFAWAAIYNLFAILLTTGALGSARIPPEYAGLGEIVSVLPVVIIAVQLKWVKIA